jgi:DNA-binding IclR family transcriptional regulator
MAVRIGVLAGDDVVIIHHQPRPDGSRQMPEIGIVIPAHASALGKALLGFLPTEADRILAESHRSMTVTRSPTLASCAPSSPPSPAQHWRKRKMRPYSANRASQLRSSACTVSPSAQSALSCPTTDWPVSEGVLDIVRGAARNISLELGAAHWPAQPR